MPFCNFSPWECCARLHQNPPPISDQLPSYFSSRLNLPSLPYRLLTRPCYIISTLEILRFLEDVSTTQKDAMIIFMMKNKKNNLKNLQIWMLILHTLTSKMIRMIWKFWATYCREKYENKQESLRNYPRERRKSNHGGDKGNWK